MRIDLKAAALAGIIAGIVFLMLEMLLVTLVDGMSPWGPPRMMAAIVMGKGALPPPASFDMMIMVVAMMVHFVLSIVLGIVFAMLVGRRAMSSAAFVAAGALFGAVVYFVNFYGMTALFPWFAMARNLNSLIAHLVFGAVLALAYRRFAAPADAL